MLKSSYLGYQCKIRGFCDQDMFTMISLFRSSSVQSRRVMINILPKPPTAIKSFNSIKLAGNLSKSETTLLSHCFEADKKISCCKKEGNNWKLYKTIRSTLLEEKLLQTPHRELGRGWFHVLRFFSTREDGIKNSNWRNFSVQRKGISWFRFEWVGFLLKVKQKNWRFVYICLSVRTKCFIFFPNQMLVPTLQ